MVEKLPQPQQKLHYWAVLSDEQMSNGYPFSLLNDEQMSNKVRVEHQPDKTLVFTRVYV